MNKNGAVINARSGVELNAKDYDHWSGRFSLYTRDGDKVTVNRANIYRTTFGRNF